ncbi:MAG: hypothetical protein WCY86_13270 [Spirosomataceae bacterium]
MIVFFVTIRLVVYGLETPLLIAELNWMLTGEQMGKGFMLYRDIWQNISVLSAVVYWGVDFLFGRSQSAYFLVASGVGLFQVLYFNFLCNSRNFFPEATAIPGLIYAVLLNLSYDMFTLSPILMATTFLLLACGVLARMIERPEVNDEIFEAGIYIGLATLFYLPTAVFYVWAFVAMIFYSGARFRHHMIGLFGSIFPLLIVVLIYFFNNALDSLGRSLFTNLIQLSSVGVEDLLSFLFYWGFSLGLAIAGFVRMFGFNRFTYYQTRIQQVMAFWFFFSAFTIPFIGDFKPMDFILFTPAVAYFVSWLFLSFRRQGAAEGLFLAYGLYSGFVLSTEVFRPFPGFDLGNMQQRIAKAAILPVEINGKKIVVLGEDEGEYLNNFAATPYLNWRLSSYDFESLDSFENVINIYKNFEKDPPEYVIDKEGIMPRLLERIPEMKEKYKPTVWKNIYDREP